MSTIQEQIDLLEAEKLVANQMIIDANNQVTSLENAISAEETMIEQYNQQIEDLNAKIIMLNNSNQVRDDIITELVNNSETAFKKKKGKKK